MPSSGKFLNLMKSNKSETARNYNGNNFRKSKFHTNFALDKSCTRISSADRTQTHDLDHPVAKLERQKSKHREPQSTSWMSIKAKSPSTTICAKKCQTLSPNDARWSCFLLSISQLFILMLNFVLPRRAYPFLKWVDASLWFVSRQWLFLGSVLETSQFYLFEI